MYESREERVELEPPASGLRYVILDTSAVYHDFDLSNRETVTLVQSAERHGFRVCVPEIVILEMTSHCVEQLEKTRRDLDEARRFLRRVLSRDVELRFTSEELTRTARTYEVAFRRRLRQVGVQILRLPRGTSAVRNLLWRERLKRKPFKSNGQGVRDALIWESVLELCRREPGQIVLITGNVKDFGNDKGDDLHPQLLEDLANVGVEQPELHRSIGAFNSAEQGLRRALAAVTTDEDRPASEPHRDQ